MNLQFSEKLEPFDFLLFGATGDLSMRKLLPALYFRHCEGQLPSMGRIVGVARSKLSTAEFLQRMEEQARPHIIESEFMQEHWEQFLERITYCLLYTSPSPRDATLSRMPSSA